MTKFYTKTILLGALIALGCAKPSKAQDPLSSMEVYGHVMLDMGYNFGQINPNWAEVMRPTQLPSFKNQYGTDGNAYMSVRQTRFGIKKKFDTDLGELFTQFEFEMFGTGVDAGQTTFRLRHAYAELGQFGAGQYWSPFMDIDVFPNTLEYWGPNGMVFFRNVQFRWMPLKGADKFTVALERPGASADQGAYQGIVELAAVESRFPVPDLSAEYRKSGSFGYVELASMVRYISWEDQDNLGVDYTGNEIGWGLNLSTNLNLGKKDVFRGQLVYGRGIQNYMNDATVDVSIENTDPSDSLAFKAVALPILGVVAFLDHRWNDKFTSSIGYSMSDTKNSNAQLADAFSIGHYAIANVIYYPAPNVLFGLEYQYCDRENFKDGWDASSSKIQFSAKYNFSTLIK